MTKVTSSADAESKTPDFNKKVRISKDDAACLCSLADSMKKDEFTREDLELFKEIIGRY